MENKAKIDPKRFGILKAYQKRGNNTRHNGEVQAYFKGNNL